VHPPPLPCNSQKDDALTALEFGVWGRWETVRLRGTPAEERVVKGRHDGLGRVVSWWGFNQAVLEELRRRFTDAHRPPVKAQRALMRLSLDRLDVTEVSQIVADAFAGDTWFEAVSVLDGHAPNANHHVMAAWAQAGSVGTIITTNFDTLIERALADVAVPHRVFNALLDQPPAEVGDRSVVVLKLHGTVSHRSSLVDLATQKRRGLPEAWLDWLERTFASHHVAVAGFSGADLALGEDYLRLKSAANATPSLRWMHRLGQTPVDEAQKVVSLGGSRFVFVEGNLPDDWHLLGAPATALSRAGSRTSVDQCADDVAPDVSGAITRWLEHPMVDADTCGIALSRLIRQAGSWSAAQALRTSILTRARRRLREGLGLTAATRVALQIAAFAKDEPIERAAQAIYCLDLAGRALDGIVSHFPTEASERVDVRQELASNQASIQGTIASIEARRGRVRESAAAVLRAEEHASILTGDSRLPHDTQTLIVMGLLAFQNGDYDKARDFMRSAQTLAVGQGRQSQARVLAELLNQVDERSPAPEAADPRRQAPRANQ
jgi:hypothetical protein